jgi:hypothetical protein
MNTKENTSKELTLSANDGYPVIRKAVRMLRAGCQANAYTRWLQPRELVRKGTKASSHPIGWSVELPNRGSISITPDAIIGFTVKASVDRILLLSVDYGSLPVSDEGEDSLFLRTKALVEAACNQPGIRLRSAHVFVAWIMRNSKRLEELRNLTVDLGYPGILFVEESTFFQSEDVLFVKWKRSNGSSESIV